MSEAVADLYVILRAETATIIAGLVETGAAGERMTAQLLGATAEVDAAFTRMTAGVERSAAAVTAADTEIAAATDRLAVAAKTAAVETNAAAAGMGERFTAAAAVITEDGARIVTAYGETAVAAQAAADKMAASAMKAAEAQSAASAQIEAGLAGVRAAEAEAAASNELLGARMAGTAEGMGGAARAAGTFKAGLNDAAGVIGLTGGQLMGLAAGAGVVAVATVKMAGDFQAATTRLVTSANEVDANLGMVRDGILAMAGQVGYSSEELAKAMYKIESGGQHGADGLKVLQAAAEGAKTENADLTVVGDAVTTMLIDYHGKADDAATITSKLVQATASGKMTFEELAKSLSSVAPIASAAKISMDDMLGTLASMTSHGISAEQATQNMSDAIRHLQNPTSIMRTEMAMLHDPMTGLSISADDVAAKLGQRGLAGTMEYLQQAIAKSMPPGSEKVFLDLKTAVQQSTPAVQELAMKVMDGSMTMKNFTKAAGDLDVVSAKQAKSFATLAGTTHQLGTETKSGEEVLQTYGGALAKAMGDATGLKVALMTTGENAGYTNDAISRISGTTTEAGGHVKGWAEIQGNFNQKLAEAKDGLGAMAIAIGEKLLPVVTPIISAFASFTSWVSQNQVASAAVAIVIGVVLVAAFVALAAAAWTAAVGVIAATWPILLIIAAVAALAYGIYELVTHWSSVVDFFTGIWDSVKQVFTDAIDFIVNLWTDFVSGFNNPDIGIALDSIEGFVARFGQIVGDVVRGVIGFFTGIPGAIGVVVDWFGSLPGKIGSALASLGSTILTAIGNVAAWLVKPFVDGWNAVIEFFSQSPRQIGEEIGHGIGVITRAGLELSLGLARGIVDGYHAVVTFFTDTLPNGIANFLLSAGQWLYKTGSDLITGLNRGIFNAWTAVVTFFTDTLPRAIVGFLVSSGQWLIKTGTDLITGLNQGIFDAWTAVVAWFVALPGRVGAFFAGVGQWLFDKGKQLITGSRDGIVSEWDTVVAWFVALPGRIGDFFATAGTWLFEAGKNLINGLWNGAKDIWNGFTGWISDMTGGAVDGFNKGFGNQSPSTKLFDTGVNVMQGLRNGVESQRGGFMDFVNGIGPNVVNLFSNAGSWLWNAGYNVVMGLWNGIQSVGSWLYNAVSSWASGILNAAKSALGIRSPSVHMHEMGGFMAKGLAAGLDDHTILATAAASRMATAVLKAANPGGISVGGITGGGGSSLAATASSGLLTGVGAGSSGPSVVTNHFIVNVAGSVMSEDEMLRKFQQGLLEHNVRNSSNGTSYSGFGR